MNPYDLIKSLSKHALASIETKLHVLAEKPVELVMGGEDYLVEEKVIEHWQKHFPNAKVSRVPDARHYIQEESPDQVAAAIKRVLDQQPQ